MNLIHITGHVYAHPDEIAKIEGFPLTLLIKVTLRDGSVYERFVSEEQIAYWTTDAGIQKQREAVERSWRLTAGHAFVAIRLTREQAFERELRQFLNGYRRMKP